MQQSYKKKKKKTVYIQSTIQAKDSKRLQKSTKDYSRLHQSTDSTERLHKTPEIMANCNPVIPVMDWTVDAELHKRYIEWKGGGRIRVRIIPIKQV